ncbi:MAG: threonylcarbamoyl-AMP synthase [Bacteroidetes bacterium]|nr:MAG: threonylcarbamoyl-AMP synthase [Bacteroidota bacterium]
MRIKMYEENPSPKNLEKISQVLKDGGIIVIPTDTVYAFAADLYNHDAFEKLCRFKGVKPKEANFSLICKDLSNLSEYTTPLPNHIFRAMKKALPGPFTFILNANNNVPKIFKSSKKTIGIRVPDNNIPRAIVELLGNPLVATSLKDDDDVVEYLTDPELIEEKYGKQVDLIVDGGYGNNVASTVVDCTDDEIEIIRAGVGDVALLV